MVDLCSMNISELRKIAKNKGFKHSGLKKNQLCTALNALETDNDRRLTNLSLSNLKTLAKSLELSKRIGNRQPTELEHNIIATLADKLCRCIKKVKDKQGRDESAAIAICISSIFKNRGLKMHGFRCSEKKGLLLPDSDTGYILGSDQ